jgi:hypothetical protein
MPENKMSESDKINRITELYSSLSEEGRDELISRILESEEIMGRILGALIAGDEIVEDGPVNTDSFVNFLRKVKE